jgi:hypothetical protein
LEIENYITDDLLNKGITFIQDRVKQIDLILGKYQKNIGGFIGGLAAVTSDTPIRFRSRYLQQISQSEGFQKSLELTELTTKIMKAITQI